MKKEKLQIGDHVIIIQENSSYLGKIGKIIDISFIRSIENIEDCREYCHVELEEDMEFEINGDFITRTVPIVNYYKYKDLWKLSEMDKILFGINIDF